MSLESVAVHDPPAVCFQHLVNEFLANDSKANNLSAFEADHLSKPETISLRQGMRITGLFFLLCTTSSILPATLRYFY